ncbi:DHA2 family efflux MFS transporter permease subunit [Flavobacterium agricola]|uniref:DHA2 family efflux MFS transporter permease subunit n=2 Tax=Flavobacterium agricola TaxID=2870839 RepID=A0ABY6M4L3_9FLAO|nr:DHA2 family efflux MFS transporter permease subunit [Flavobacterium agricola]
MSQNQDFNPAKEVLPWLTALAFFMQALDGTILNTALPAIAKDFNQSSLQMQSVVISYTVTLAILIPLSGWLSDRYGTKKIFTLSVVLFTFGSVLCAFSYDIFNLVCARIIQAAGGAMMVPVARLAILYTYPKNQLLRVMNFITIPGLVGQVVGPSLGGFLSDYYSWHWVFLINIPIGIIGVVLTQKKMPNITKPVGKFDGLGLLYISTTIVALTVIMELISLGITKWTYLTGAILLTFIAIILYIKRSRKHPKPIIDLTLFKVDTLRIGLLGNLFTRLGVGGMPFLLPLLLQVGYGHSAAISGLMLIPSALANMLAKYAVVPLIQRFGYRTVLITNTLILAFIITSFSLTDKSTPLLYFIPLMLFFGSANSIQMSSMNTITIADLNNDTASSGNSLLAIMQQLSNSFGVSIAALILSLMPSFSATTMSTADAFKYTFITIGVITALSSLVFGNLKPTAGSDLSGR